MRKLQQTENLQQKQSMQLEKRTSRMSALLLRQRTIGQKEQRAAHSRPEEHLLNDQVKRASLGLAYVTLTLKLMRRTMPLAQVEQLRQGRAQIMRQTGFALLALRKRKRTAPPVA